MWTYIGEFEYYKNKLKTAYIIQQGYFKVQDYYKDILTVHLYLTQSVKKLLAENFFLKTKVDPQKSIWPTASTPPLVW